MKQLKKKIIVADGTRLKPNKKNQRQNLDESSYLRWKCKYHVKLNKLDMVQNSNSILIIESWSIYPAEEHKCNKM